MFCDIFTDPALIHIQNHHSPKINQCPDGKNVCPEITGKRNAAVYKAQIAESKNTNHNACCRQTLFYGQLPDIFLSQKRTFQADRNPKTGKIDKRKQENLQPETPITACLEKGEYLPVQRSRKFRQQKSSRTAVPCAIQRHLPAPQQVKKHNACGCGHTGIPENNRNVGSSHQKYNLNRQNKAADQPEGNGLHFFFFEQIQICHAGSPLGNRRTDPWYILIEFHLLTPHSCTGSDIP